MKVQLNTHVRERLCWSVEGECQESLVSAPYPLLTLLTLTADTSCPPDSHIMNRAKGVPILSLQSQAREDLRTWHEKEGELCEVLKSNYKTKDKSVEMVSI